MKRMIGSIINSRREHIMAERLIPFASIYREQEVRDGCLSQRKDLYGKSKKRFL